MIKTTKSKGVFNFEVYGDKAYIILSYLFQLNLPFVMKRKHEIYLKSKEKYGYLDKYIKPINELLSNSPSIPFHYYETYAKFVKSQDNINIS